MSSLGYPTFPKGGITRLPPFLESGGDGGNREVSHCPVHAGPAPSALALGIEQRFGDDGGAAVVAQDLDCCLRAGEGKHGLQFRAMLAILVS